MVPYSQSSPICHRRVPIQVLLVPLLLLTAASLTFAQSEHDGTRQATIVIDPGHGGGDTGTVGLSGTAEKSFVLNVGRKLAAELGKSYQVMLTRRDDYELAAINRTAVANRHQANLFISLHGGASFSRQPSGYNVYFHRQNMHNTMSASSTLPKIEMRSGPPMRWHNTQSAHQRTSEQLAERICRHLRGQNPETDCHTYGLPLLLLEGAAMPAVIIELGYLTNPSDEKKMKSPLYQNRLVKTISSAISGFLKADTPR